MGRLSEFICFINEKTMPNKLQIQHRYTSISITEEVKKLRRDHQRRLKKDRRDKNEAV